jgi:putative ABC transport system permease protein
VAVLGETVARQLFGDSDPVGQIVRVRRVPLEVIGVLTSKGQNHHGVDRDDGIFVPLSTLRSRLVGGGFAKIRLVHTVWVKLWTGADIETAKSEIRSLLRQRHRLQPGQEDDFTLREMSELLAAREESARVMTLLLGAIASIALVVGGIGIMNTMLVSVAERTREIGIRMAVGARRRDILSQFLMEALALALAGGVCGTILGVGGAHAIAYFAGWHTHIQLNIILLAVTSAAAVGLFFGFYPAHKASRMLPIQALR